MEDSQISGTWTRADSKLHINCLQSGNFSLTPLGYRALGPPQVGLHTRLSEHDSRLLISTKSANNDRVESPSRDRNPNLQDMEISNSGLICFTVYNTHLPQFMSLIPEPQALAIGALSQGRSMYVSIIPFAQQSLRNYMPPRTVRPNHGSHPYFDCVWTTIASFHTTEIYCHNRDLPWMESRTVCMDGGPLAALPSSRIFRGGL